MATAIWGAGGGPVAVVGTMQVPVDTSAVGTPTCVDFLGIDTYLSATVQALTNKTIDGDLNTVTDLPLTAIKTVLGDALKLLARDAAGIPISATLGTNLSWAGSTLNAAGGGGAPGGASGQIQYNNASAFDGALLWQATNIIQQRNGTSAQKVEIYRTTDAGITNYERLALNNPSSGQMSLAAETAGTGTDNIGIAIVPAGTGAFTLAVPDSGVGGGNARGIYSVDLQLANRSAASQVASGQASFLGAGYQNSARGSESVVVGGQTNDAFGIAAFVGSGATNSSSGNYAFNGSGQGNTVSGTHGFNGSGQNNTVSGNYAANNGGYGNTVSGIAASGGGGESNNASGSRSWIPGGIQATTRGLYGAYAYASGLRATQGDAQAIGQPVRKQSTGVASVTLTADDGAVSATNIMVMPNNSMVQVTAYCAGYDTAGNAISQKIEATFKRGANAASTAIVGAAITTNFGIDAALVTAAFTLVADTTQGGPVVKFAGVAATTINTCAKVECVQVF